MSGATSPVEEVRRPEPSGRAQGTVRRLIVYTLLGVLVVIAAIGVAGLLGRLLESTTPIASRGEGDLALSLAFTLMGGPLAALLWWSVWRRLADDTERGSLAWGLYLTVLYVVSLSVATSALLIATGAAIDGRWDPAAAATAVTWALVWADRKSVV